MNFVCIGQFAFGALIPSGALQTLEIGAMNDEPKLQTSFDNFDDCSSKSNMFNNFHP